MPDHHCWVIHAEDDDWSAHHRTRADAEWDLERHTRDTGKAGWVAQLATPCFDHAECDACGDEPDEEPRHFPSHEAAVAYALNDLELARCGWVRVGERLLCTECAPVDPEVVSERERVEREAAHEPLIPLAEVTR